MKLLHRLRHLLFVCIFFTTISKAQTGPTEFPKEFILHLKLSSGLISEHNARELFVGSLDLRPQWTLVPYKFRGGFVIGGAYAARRLSGLGGLTVSYKLSEFRGGYFGSLGNLHVNLDHLWGTKDQRLLGGGLNLDLLNKVVIGVGGLRDYHFANWWWTTSVAFRLSKVKNTSETGIPR